MNLHKLALAPLLLITLSISSCGILSQPKAAESAIEPIKQEVETKTKTLPITDYASFKAQPDYPKTSKSYKNTAVLSGTNASNSSIRVSIPLQRAFLMNGDKVALDYPVSTGKSSHPTPAGSYSILKMVKDKRSNLYGKVYDAEGNITNSSADSRTAEIPAGGEFLGAAMPYWMRLTWSGIGMHVGAVPRYPASHACIRGQSSIVPIIFSKVKVGTSVTITD